jgi:hypothetical protein
MNVRHPHQKALRGNDNIYLDRPSLPTPHTSTPALDTYAVYFKVLFRIGDILDALLIARVANLCFADLSFADHSSLGFAALIVRNDLCCGNDVLYLFIAETKIGFPSSS